jgi:hypothetical protein
VDPRKQHNRARENRGWIVPLDDFAERQRLAGVKVLNEGEVQISKLEIRIGTVRVFRLDKHLSRWGL